jgi:GntR family transcriptional regulator
MSIVSSPIPLYYLISSAIQRRIEDGDYPVGMTIPTEEEFTQEFGVSRATVRQAVSELVQSGLVSRRRGAGTVVLPAVNHRIGQRFRGSLADLMSETRRTGVRALVVARSTPLAPRIAELLQLDEPVGTVVRRSRTLDGEPFAYTVNYLPDRYGELLDEDQLNSESLMALLEAAGVSLTGARQSIRPQLASLEVGKNIGLDVQGAPVLFVERVVWGIDEVPVEVAQTWYRGDVYEYTVTFELTQSRDDALDKFA